MKLTAKVCQARADCMLEAAEHLTVAWCDPSAREVAQIDWAYAQLMRLVDKWEVMAGERSACP